MNDTIKSPAMKPRSRISLSCAECRRRKVKCDRKLPCSACVRCNRTSACGYFGHQFTAERELSAENVLVFRAFSEESARPCSLPEPESEIKTEEEPYSQQDQHQRKIIATGCNDQVFALNRKCEKYVLEKGKFQPAHHAPMTKGSWHVEVPMGFAPDPLATSGTFSQIPAPRLPEPQNLARPLYLPSSSYLPSRAFKFPPPLAVPQMNLVGESYQGRMPHKVPSSGQGMDGPTLPEGLPTPAYPQKMEDSNLCAYKLHSGNAPDMPLKNQERPVPIESTRPLLSRGSWDSHSLKNQRHYIGVVQGNPHSISSEADHLLHDDTTSSQAITRTTSAIFSPAGEISTRLCPSNFSWSGLNPYDLSDPDEVFDLYSGYNPILRGTNVRKMNHGPFSWYTFVQRDQVLRTLWDYAHESPEVTTFVEKRATNVKEKADKQDKLGEDTHYEHEIKVELNKRAISLGLTVFEGEVDSNMHLVDKIKLMLPTKKALLVLVGQFFKIVYPFFPLIDEHYFCNEMRRILGPFSDREENHSEVRVTRRDDIASLGILLLVLRMSYLAVLSNQKSENEQILSANQPSSKLEESKYILTNPINIDVVSISQQCLDQYDFYQRTSLTVFQCAVLMRAYLSIAPEEGDSGDGYASNMLNVVCIQAAYCLGLNRDPNVIHNHEDNPRLDHLQRKLWFFIRLMDMKSSYQFGFPLMLDDDYSDTEIPKFFPGCSNIADAAVEEKVCASMHIIADLYSRMRLLLQSSISIKQSISVRELTTLLTDLESETKIKLGTLSELLRPVVNQSKLAFFEVLKTKTYLTIKSFNLSIIYHLFLNYERSKKHDLAFFYLRKFFSFSSGEFLVELLHMIKQKGLFCSETSTSGYILNPPITFLIHKSNQLNIRLIIVLNYMISTMEHNQESHRLQLLNSPDYKVNYSRICKLAKLLKDLNNFSNSCLSMLGNRFLYAWKVSKTHTFLLDTVVSKGFLESRSSSRMEPLVLTPDRVKDLLVIAQKAHHAVKKSCQTQKHQEPFNPPLPGVNTEINNTQFCDKQSGISPNLSKANEKLSHLYHHGTQCPIQSQFYADSFCENISELSSCSSSTFELGEFDLGDTQEIEDVWQQLSSIKNFNRLDVDGVFVADEVEGYKSDGVENDYYNKLFASVTPNDMFHSVNDSTSTKAF